MNKKYLKIIGVVLIIAIVGFGGYKAFSSDAGDQVVVQVGEVKKEAIASTIFTNGKVVSDDTRNLSFPISGEVSQVNFEKGDYITKGDIIAKLDTEDYQREIDKLKLTLATNKNNLNKYQNNVDGTYLVPYENAQLNYEKAKKQYEDGQQLYDAGAISQSQLQDYKHAMDVAYNNYLSAQSTYQSVDHELRNLELTVESTELAIQNLEEKIENSYLEAPINGVLTEKLVNESEYAVQDNPAFILEDLENLNVETTISQFDINQVKIGQTVEISRIGDETSVQGEVIDIGKTAIESGQSSVVPVEIKLNEATDFKTNFTVNVELTTASNDNAIVIPYESIYTNKDGENMIYEVIDNTVKAHTIKTGIRGDLMVELVSPVLDEGTKIILSPTQAIEDGIQVKYAQEN
jgi:HlyD family secretion protein